MYPIPMQPTERTQDIQPIPTQRVPARQTAMPSVSARPTQAPMQRTFRRTATPALPDPPSVALAPVPAVLPPVLPVPPATPMVLPSLQLNQSAPRSSYPSAWQDLIDHSCLFLLHDMLFSHPFPSGFDGQKWAREAVSSAFFSYSRAFGIDLDKKSCESTVVSTIISLILPTVDEHRSNIVNLVSALHIFILYILTTPFPGPKGCPKPQGQVPIDDPTNDLRLEGPWTRSKNLCSSRRLPCRFSVKYEPLPRCTVFCKCAQSSGYHLYLTCIISTTQGDERPENAMYRSPILKKAIETLYTTSPWSAAINLPWLKDDGYHSGPQLTSSDNQGYTSCPPTSFVAFAASAVSRLV